MTSPSRLERFFAGLVGRRFVILAIYAVLVPGAALLAMHIPSEGSIGQLIVPSDPDAVATRAFEKVFPEDQLAMLLFETDRPFRPEVLREVDALERSLRTVPGATVYGLLDIYRRAHPGAVLDEQGARALASFAGGADMFRRQGLVGDDFLGLAVSIHGKDPKRVAAVLRAIDEAIARTPHPEITRVRRVGEPYVESWITRESSQATLRYFPLLGVLVVAVALFLYRSLRTLVAILLALASAVALGVGAGAVLGYSFTLVSALVPLTIMVTTLATLVYLQSRFVLQPEGTEVDAHQAFALANKLLPVSVSAIAAVLGFGALAVSHIRPIREMGIWTAVGLAIGWVVSFTLFPALQKVLRTPTGRVVPVRSYYYDRLAAALPGWTYRWRWPLVVGALVLMVSGGLALFGVPGRLAPMRIGTDSLDYVDERLPVYQDLLFFREHVSGLNVARVWVQTPPGEVTSPEVLRGLDRFATALEHSPDVASVVGPTTFLRMRRYLAGQGATIPDDPAVFASAAADVEQLLLTQPELRAFIDVNTLSSAQLTIVFNHGERAGYEALERAVAAAWSRTRAEVPALAGAHIRVVGEALLQAKVGASLVPTLTESFALTAGLIFFAFLLVFRSLSARLLAMIPSLFAILVTFLFMRLGGGSLNVATILIATTVLGTTENDQIHFFHHMQEGNEGGFEHALRHSLAVAGRAIVFATFINAFGFLGLTVSSFPPVRQFGLVTAAAFLLGMLADFTALPAALWIVARARPRGARNEAPAEASRREAEALR